MEHAEATTDPSHADYWNIRDIQFSCRVSRSTAWRMVREDDFPSPIVYGTRLVVWPRAEVIEFLERRRDPHHYAVADTKDRTATTFTARSVRRRSA